MNTSHNVAIIFAASALVTAYFVWARPYFKTLPTLSQVYAREQHYLSTIGQWLKGRRTMLIGLWGEGVAILPDLLNIVSGFDLKTMFNLPDQWAMFVTMGVVVLMTIFRAKASEEY